MAYLVLYWAERGTDSVPMLDHGMATKQRMPSRVEEYSILQYESEEDRAHGPLGVVLARLVKIRRLWKVDQEFHVCRAKA
jgi:hypothetical protein